MFTVNPRSTIPLYEQLEQNIISMIASGVLAADDQLPSVRSLARDLGLNPNTVQKAYSHLEDKGVIYQATGRGSFVASVATAMDRISHEKLIALRESFADAKRAGISLEQIIETAKSVFEEGKA